MKGGKGGPLKFTVVGSYDSVEFPYQILNESQMMRYKY